MTAELIVVQVAASVGLVAVAYMTITLALLAYRKVRDLWSALLDGVAIETK